MRPEKVNLQVVVRAAVGVLLQAAIASGYSLSISPAPALPGPPAASASVTLTVTLSGAESESILSAQALIRVTDFAGYAVSGLTLSGGTGLRSDMIFAQYQDVNSGNVSTQSASSPTTSARYRALFAPTNDDGFPIPQTLVNGILMTVVLNISAGLAPGRYSIDFVGAGTPGGSDATDTFISLSSNIVKNADSVTGTSICMSCWPPEPPEPTSALLMMPALLLLRRRSLARPCSTE